MDICESANETERTRVTFESVTDGMAHSTEMLETNGTIASLTLEDPTVHMQMQLDALTREVAELRDDFKKERFQHNATLSYILASLQDLQDRPVQHVLWRWPWEKRNT
jgi:hypothetical protein